MKDYESTEIAYKNGYAQGKKDAVKHGRWAHKYYPTVWYGPGEPPEWICSVCQDRAYNTYDYCPNCGAKMDLEG